MVNLLVALLLGGSLSGFGYAADSVFSTSKDSATFITPAAPTLTQDLFFGTTVEDPYRWLEDRTSEKVHAWETAQHEKAAAYLSQLPMRQTLLHRVKELFNEEEVSVPREAGWKIFFNRRTLSQDQPTVYWRGLGLEDDHVLLKPPTNGDEVIEDWSVSPDGKKIAYRLKKKNSEEAVLHVRWVDTWREDPIDQITGADISSLCWSEDSQGFYYVRLPLDTRAVSEERLGKAKVRFHSVGQDPDQDPVVFPETHNARLRLSPSLSRDGRWLFVSVSNGGTSTNIFYREVRESSASFKPLFLSTSATAEATEWGGALYMRTNERAPNFRIVKTFVRQPAPSSWVTLVPERPDTEIRSMTLVSGYLVLTIVKNAMVGIEVRGLDGSLIRTALAPAPGEFRDVRSQEYSDSVYFDFDSVVAPRQIYRMTIPKGSLSAWSSPKNRINDSQYEGHLITYRSNDGTWIPMDIIARKGMPLDGSVPFLIDAPNGLGAPAPLRFDPMVMAWLESGGGYALPHVRGTGDYGPSWHERGRGTQKQKAIEDLIAAADYLLEKKYTSRDHLALQGVSHGSVVAGGAMTQRPELFRAVVFKSPLFDMIRYPLFGQGRNWIPEYGSPEVEDQFRALIGYSPYHHVKPGTVYPSVLLITPRGDERIDPLHARKMTAALQAVTGSMRLILLKTEQEPSSPVADVVDRLSFLMTAFEMK